MPLLGAGIIPSGPIGLELEATVRRVFAQMVVILIYKQNPLLALLLRNAIRASGGVSPYKSPKGNIPASTNSAKTFLSTLAWPNR